MELKITGLSPETRIHLSCGYDQFIKTPLMHGWETEQRRASIRRSAPSHPCSLLAPKLTRAQILLSLPLLSTAICMLATSYTGARSLELTQPGMNFLPLASRIHMQPFQYHHRSQCTALTGRLGAHQRRGDHRELVCKADFPAAGRGSGTTATFGQDLHAEPELRNFFSLPPFDLLGVTGGMGFTSLPLTNQPVNVSHMCSQTCLGLNAFVFMCPFFLFFLSFHHQT